MKFDLSMERLRFIVAGAFILMCGTLVSAQPDKPVTDSGARIEFEETTFDFGDITDRIPVSHRFKFRNTGTEVLQITEVNWGCSCTSARALKMEIAPGEESAIEVTFDPRYRQGPYNKNANVFTNDPTSSLVRLWYKADIDPIYSVFPTPVKILNVAFRHEGKGEFYLVSDRPEFKITAVESKSGPFSGRVLRSETVDKQPEWRAQKDGRPIHQVFMEVTVGKDAEIGPLTGELLLTMHVVNDAGEEFDHQIEVPVMATVLGPIEINPGRVNFGRWRAGDEVRRTIRINSRTDLDDFKIVSIDQEAQNDLSPSVEWAEVVLADVNRAYEVHLRMTVPEKPQLYRGILIVNTDSPFEPVVRIPWTLSVRQ